MRGREYIHTHTYKYLTVFEAQLWLLELNFSSVRHFSPVFLRFFLQSLAFPNRTEFIVGPADSYPRQAIWYCIEQIKGCWNDICNQVGNRIQRITNLCVMIDIGTQK